MLAPRNPGFPRREGGEWTGQAPADALMIYGLGGGERRERGKGRGDGRGEGEGGWERNGGGERRGDGRGVVEGKGEKKCLRLYVKGGSNY